MALESPEEEALGGGATVEGGEEVATIVFAVFFVGAVAVTDVFVRGCLFEREGFSSGGGGEGGDEIEGGDDEGVLELVRFFEGLDDAADTAVHGVYHGGVCAAYVRRMCGAFYRRG